MKLNQLIKTSHSSYKRLGRGHGSGRGGHTSSRGAKGDKARGKTKLLFEGVKTKKSLIKRLPFIRGKDKLHPRCLVQTVNLTQLKKFDKDSVITLKSLYDKGLIRNPKTLVKLLADGSITVALKVAIPCSKSAAGQITQAGGKVITSIEIKA